MRVERRSRALLLLSLAVAVASSHQAEPRAKAPTKNYLIYSEPFTWNSASRYCRERQSHLAFPANLQDYDVIQGLMTSNGFTQIHLGMHDFYWEGKYYTEKGELLTDKCHVQWAPGHPSGGEANNCGGMTSDGMVDVACSSRQPFICEENLTWSGYELINGLGYYKHYTDAQRTWPQALELCRLDGSHMLLINSHLEYKAVSDKFDFGEVWVGVQHILQDKHFVTIFDADLKNTGYARWAPGEPSGSNSDKPYAAALADTAGLAVRGAADTLHVICERGQHDTHERRK